tara:strand:+ start:33 stop:296 length:264 start_codon:yes stop_codon:yes gene_type:complete
MIKKDTILSLHFGRTFWLDDEKQFCSAPTFKDGTTHWDMWDYVSEWDMEDVNFERLFDIHRNLSVYRYIETTVSESYAKKRQVYQGA